MRRVSLRVNTKLYNHMTSKPKFADKILKINFEYFSKRD